MDSFMLVVRSLKQWDMSSEQPMSLKRHTSSSKNFWDDGIHSCKGSILPLIHLAVYIPCLRLFIALRSIAILYPLLEASLVTTVLMVVLLLSKCGAPVVQLMVRDGQYCLSLCLNTLLAMGINGKPILGSNLMSELIC